jgi:hypothetical protein
VSVSVSKKIGGGDNPSFPSILLISIITMSYLLETPF